VSKAKENILVFVGMHLCQCHFCKLHLLWRTAGLCLISTA
jgi:hypothetical protein